jgi:hypothetical protein
MLENFERFLNQDMLVVLVMVLVLTSNRFFMDYF